MINESIGPVKQSHSVSTMKLLCGTFIVNDSKAVSYMKVLDDKAALLAVALRREVSNVLS